MPLNKSAGNMYSWVSHTWNPVKGQCGYACSYCYVEKIAKRFGRPPSPLHLDGKELRTFHGIGNVIFVCSGCDLFHHSVPREWIISVLAAARQYHNNSYLWHTKNPGRVSEFSDELYPDNSILCTTIETNRKYECMASAPDPLERAASLSTWKKKRMITVEPILDFDGGPDGFARLLLMAKPEQVNIGADSGHNHLPEPGREKLKALLDILDTHTRIHLKKNLRRILPESGYYEGAV